MAETLRPVADTVIGAADLRRSAEPSLTAETELIIASLSMPGGDALRLVSHWRS